MNELRFVGDASDLKRLELSFRAAPGIAIDEMARFFTAATLHLQREIQNLTPTAHGLLRQSVIAQTNVIGLGVESVVGSSLAYAEPVELGTKPHMPPLEPLLDWVKQKIPVGNAYGAAAHRRQGKPASSSASDAAAMKIARAIQWKIAHYGTPGAGMFHMAWTRNQAQISVKFNDVVNRIVQRAVGGA